MENRERTLLDAATQVFLRYGVKRTSMGDIAAEAGVSRQTLYNFYANKDEVLRGSIRMFGVTSIAAIDEALPQCGSVEDAVSLILDEMSVKPYAFLHASPNAEDLIEGYNEAGRDEMLANYLAFEARLATVFAPHDPHLQRRGLTAALLAEIVRRAAAAFKSQATDTAHLERLIKGLVASVAGLLDTEPPP